LIAQTFADIGGVDSQLRNLGAGHIEIDALILHTGQIDLQDPLQHVEALSDCTGGFIHFRHGKSIGPKRDGGHRRIAEGIVDPRSDGAFRQIGFDISHPVAQQFPHLRKVLRGNFIFDGHMDQVLADFGGGILNLVYLTHAADFFFDGPGNQAFDLLHRHAGVFCHH